MRSFLTVLRTGWYRVWYQWILKKCEFGEGVQVRCPLRIKGPGLISIGHHSTLERDLFGDQTVVMVTHATDARIAIGPFVVLRGVSLGCLRRIEIGADSLIEDAHMIDADFHPIEAAARRAGHLGSWDAVTIGASSYVGSKAIIMKGAVLGPGTVVDHGSVLGRQKTPVGARVRGYPSRLVKVDGKK